MDRPAVIELVPVAPVGDDVALGDDPRGPHAEGAEDPGPQLVAVEPAGHPPHDGAEEEVPGVAVPPVIARGELDGERSGELHEVVLGIVAAIVERAVGVIRDAGGVGEQVPDGDAVPGGRAGHVPADGVVEPEPAIPGEHLDERGGELLPDRAGLVHRAVGGGDPVLEVATP